MHRRIPLMLALNVLMLGMLGTPMLLAAQNRADSPGAAGRKPEEGLASYYANWREGRRTASGERFDNQSLVAAHPSLPFGTTLRVTNLENGHSVDVRVIDRGPSAARRRDGYVIDLSRAAAEALGFVKAGRARVRLTVTSGPK